MQGHGHVSGQVIRGETSDVGESDTRHTPHDEEVASGQCANIDSREHSTGKSE